MAATTSSNGDFKVWVRQEERKAGSGAHWRCHSVANHTGHTTSVLPPMMLTLTLSFPDNQVKYELTSAKASIGISKHDHACNLSAQYTAALPPMMKFFESFTPVFRLSFDGSDRSQVVLSIEALSNLHIRCSCQHGPYELMACPEYSERMLVTAAE